MIVSLIVTFSILALFGLFLSGTNPVIANSNNSTVDVFGVDSEPYGLSYPEWVIKWWQWFVSIPPEENPVNDQTGVNCGVGQEGQVWLLGGTPGGFAHRTCTVPSDKGILFPVINSMCDLTISSESELLACAKADTDRAINLRANIDGIELESVRVQTPLANITYPENNIFGAPSGTTQMVSDGYYVYLKPLSPGTYDLSFGGETASTPTLGISAFATSVKYDLKVE